jgi:hypothetical protein
MCFASVVGIMVVWSYIDGYIDVSDRRREYLVSGLYPPAGIPLVRFIFPDPPVVDYHGRNSSGTGTQLVLEYHEHISVSYPRMVSSSVTRINPVGTWTQ